MEDKNRKYASFGEVISKNFQVVMVILGMIGTIYVSSKLHTVQIEDLNKKINSLEIRLEDSYQKIDEIKLDKAVFQVTMSQLSPIQEELRELRADIKEILKSLNKR